MILGTCREKKETLPFFPFILRGSLASTFEERSSGRLLLQMGKMVASLFSPDPNKNCVAEHARELVEYA